jgi:hypothetical protein
VSRARNEFNPDPNLPVETQTDTNFKAESKVQLCGIPQPALPGSSQDSYSTFHFQIDSTGEAKRGAKSQNIQAIAIIAPADTTFAPVANCPATGGGNTKL